MRINCIAAIYHRRLLAGIAASSRPKTRPSVCYQTAATGGSTRIGYKHRSGARLLLVESPAASQKPIKNILIFCKEVVNKTAII
jgi:hypothetical protein